MKIVRLEKALEVLQDCSGPEIEGLKSALKKAREAAREPPLEKHIAECKEFIERSQKRVAAETVLLEDARQGTFGATSCSSSDSARRGNSRCCKRGPSPGKIGGRGSREGRTPGPETTGNHVHPLSDPVGPECPDSSNARRRASVARLVARQTHRSQGCPGIWDTERDFANDIHGGRWCRQVGRVHDHGDDVKCGRVPQRSCSGGKDSRCGLRGVRVSEASNPGPAPLSRLRRVGLGMRVSSASRGSDEVVVSVSSNVDTHDTWINQSQEMTQDTEPAPSLLPTWVDMSRGDEVEAREPHRRRIMPRHGRLDNVRMEDEVDDVVKALERDLPMLSHTPTAMLTGGRSVLMPQTPGTPRSVQDYGVESSDTEAHEPPVDMVLGVAMTVQAQPRVPHLAGSQCWQKMTQTVEKR